MKIKNKSINPAKKAIIITAVLLVLAIPGYLVVAKYNNLWPFPSDSTTSSTDTSTKERPVNSVDYSEPTDEYLEQNEKIKAEKLKEAEERRKEEEAAASSNTKRKAQINISFADIYEGNLEIRAFITNTIEGNGTCTATVSRSGYETITASQPAFIDATSSICQPIYIPKNKLANGTWNITMKYSSPKYEGTTGQTQVEVK